jgi:hypothetical protein
MTKVCKLCHIPKDLRFFNPHKSCKHGVRTECKPCQNKASAIRAKKRNKKFPDKRRDAVLKNKYGITFDQYRVLLGAQGNACKICGSFSPGASKKYFSVDHDHKNGKIRGILCHGCNAGLGMFKEDTESLRRAAVYLEANK